MSNKSSKTRKDFIDVARGIAIISIILGHLGEVGIDRIVYTFHVPLFFIVAGLFYREESNLCNLVSKRFKTLIIPYITACIGIMIAALSFNQVIRDGTGDKKLLLYWLEAALYGAGTHIEKPAVPSIGAIWFLLALFWASIMMHYITKIDSRRAIVVVFLIVLLSCYTAQFYWLPLSVQAGGPGLLFMFVGYLSRDYIIGNKKMQIGTRAFCILSALVIWITFILQFEYFRMVCCKFEHWYDLVRSFAGCMIVLSISKVIADRLPTVTHILAYIGRYSIVVLCLHIIELNTFPYKYLLDQVGIEKGTPSYLWMQIIIKTVLCIGGMSMVIKTKKLRPFFGL